MAENLVEEVVTEVEELFKPRPGGLVDTWRKKEAARREAERERENADEPVTERAQKSVKVTQLSPEIFSAITYTIAPGGYAPILPMSMNRYRSVTTVITPSGIVILAKDQGAAISAIGFTLPYGIPPLELRTRAQVYAFNPTGTTVQVSVIAELYATENK